MKPKSIKISDFSKLSGLSLKALRLYESHGILVPTRSASNKYRLYQEDQISLAKEIANLRSTGFSIREIKALLPFRNQADGGLMTILTQQLRKTEQNLKSLTEQRNQIRQLMKQAKAGSAARLFDSNNLFVKRMVCKEVSDSIKLLTTKELLERTSKIPNTEYLQTLAMLDDVAKSRLLSVISPSAMKLVKTDLANLDKHYANYWK